MKLDLNGKTAAGIDISQQRISIALLKRGKNGLELVKTVVAPMPAGAVKDGVIGDAKLLSKAIRNLKFRSRIWTRRSAASLFGGPVVSQIIDMPKQSPTNIRQFVQNEVKNCVVLPSRDITLDFCGIGSARRSADKRVLAVAAESEKMTGLINVCGRAGFNVESIEPALFAYIRAVKGKRIVGKNKCNVLVAVLRGNSLALCVLKNGEIDFIRNKEAVSADSNDWNCWLADELSEVVGFYDTEAGEHTGTWDITVFVDDSQHRQVSLMGPAQNIEECLKSQIQAERMQVRTLQDAYMDTPVSGSVAENGERPSPIAIGLAARLLMSESSDVKINLVPQDVIKRREAQRDALVAANVVAAMLLVMLLLISAFAFMIERATSNSFSKKAIIAEHDTGAMMAQHNRLDARIAAFSSRLERIEQISASNYDVNWAQVFEEIRKATPGTVRINTLSSQDGPRLQIEGLAMSNEAIGLFVNLLEKSRSISTVTLLDAHKYNEQSQVIAYQINCKLNTRSAKSKNVG